MSETSARESALFLTFYLGRELLAVEVAQVREVLDICPITRVPGTPEYMRGVINLRGSVIPVIDLRLKFGLSRTDFTIDARIIVIELLFEGVDTVAGILTDSVQDVIEISPDDIDDSVQIGTRWRTEFVRGIGRHAEQFILLLDMSRIFSRKDVGMPSEPGEGPSL